MSQGMPKCMGVSITVHARELWTTPEGKGVQLHKSLHKHVSIQGNTQKDTHSKYQHNQVPGIFSMSSEAKVNILSGISL